jgi:chromosome segregation ATPase
MPKHLREAAKERTDHGELSERVRDLYRRIAFGEEVADHESAQRELHRVREEKDEARSDIRDRQADLEALERKETRLEERLNEHKSREDEYQGHLKSIEAHLYDGGHVFPTHGLVKEASRTAECEPEEVIDDLKERNPKIPDYAFKQAMESDQAWYGVGQSAADKLGGDYE